MYKRKHLFIALLLFCVTLVVSCTPAPIEKVEYSDIMTPEASVSPPIAPDMPTLHGFTRGVNLGNMLESPTEGEWGYTFKDEYAKIIRDAGFDFVRLPIRWSAHIDGAHHTIAPEFYRRIDHIIDTLLGNGLNIIINIHHFENMNADPEGNADTLYRIWDQLAEHYKDLPQGVVFEVLNEPSGNIGTLAWNTYQNKCIDVIRRFSPTRKILVTAAEWGGPGGIPRLKLPDDPNLIVSFHYYDPFAFTHQGADWVDRSDAYMGTQWTGNYKEKKDIDDAFSRVSEWSKTHGIPVILGEFGAYEKADMSSRALWTAFMREKAESYGFAWCYWEFCAGFGVYDPAKGDYRRQLIEALIPDATPQSLAQ